MAAQFKKIFDQMIAENKEAFIKFKLLNDSLERSLPNSKLRSDFNNLGLEILNIIKRYENMLCGKTESSSFGRYSANLSEKFWMELRRNFNNIDEIGVE